jgi:signal transduction histidine kinase
VVNPASVSERTSAPAEVADERDTMEVRGGVEFDRRTLLLARFTLYAAAAYLLIFQQGDAFQASTTAWLIGIGLAASIALFWVPEGWFRSPRFIGALMVADIAWVSAAMRASGEFSWEYIFIYYLVIFLAGIGESLALIGCATLTAGVSYLYLAWSMGGWANLSSPGMLSRLPFLVAIAAFYGYIVERAREQRRLAREERMTAERAERARRLLAERTREVERANRALRQTEERLKRLNEDLHRTSEMKSSFVSMVSHELRTPLAAMKNALEIVELRATESEDEVQHRFIDIAVRNVDRLSAMVNDLLDISRIEAGGIQLQFEETDIVERLVAVRDTFEAQAAAAGIALDIEVPKRLPPVWADRDRIEQVALNLVGNAIKFTPRDGSVRLTAETASDTVRVTVTDTGPGISSEEQEKIFDRFYQVDDSLTREITGSGLGLAICKDLTEVHGGRLAVESEPGRGAAFSFTVPVASDRAREMTELEELVRDFRRHPVFSLVLLDLEEIEPVSALGDGEPVADELMEGLERWVRSFLPRSVDRIVRQPAHRRLAIFSLSTDREGASIMLRRLRRNMEGSPFVLDGEAISSPRSFGPVEAPAEGHTGWQLAERALAAVGARR